MLLKPILLRANAVTMYARPSSSQKGQGSIQPVTLRTQTGASQPANGSLLFTIKIPSSGMGMKI